MKITVNSIKKTALVTGGLFLSSFSIIKADGNMSSGLTPEMLRPDFSRLTPEAASLGRYGAFQVSEYSGAANISIPLYTVKSGDVSFPINLYYDATGIKVEQDATFVGLGWNLSYGGMISHIVCGKDDFLETDGDWVGLRWITKWWKGKWEKLKTSIPNNPPFYLENFLNNKLGFDQYASDGGRSLDASREMELYERMSKGYDTPDIFQASFCGHNITFTIDRRRGDAEKNIYPIVVLNNNPRKYKISYKTGEKPSVYPTSFAITDDKGITYCFNAYRENPGQTDSGGLGIDSYYLTKIYGLDGENGKSVVEFKYKQVHFCFGRFSRTTSKEHKPTTRRILGGYDNMPGDSWIAFCNLTNPNSYSREIASGENGRCDKVYPDTIFTNLETIVFNTTSRSDIPGAKCISEIVIKSKMSGTTRKINFDYDYFSETTAQESHNDFSHKRLKLTSVKIDDQKYKFEYDSQNLPSFASYSKDYWGYYNGANPNDTRFYGCTPAYTITSDGVVKPEEHLDGSNRLASEKLCNVGMLKKVTYPTGGYTLYEFEANRFNDKYYYPDASNSKISFPSTFTKNDGSLNVSAGCINLCGTMTQTLTVKACQNKYDINISAVLKDASDNLTVTVKDNSGSVVKTVTYKGSNNIGETVSLSLTKNVTYTIEAKLTATQANSSSTLASCNVIHDAVYSTNDAVNSPITASPSTKNEKGGYSIGGGLRIKSIKNYDAPKNGATTGDFLNGTLYEYSGGKLLSPTVQLETHFVDCKYDMGPNIRFSFLYANTEPSYPYICSLGLPATVGYDRVVKKEIDKNGNVLRKTAFDFHNYGYDSSTPTYQINLLMQNAFYYPPTTQGNLTNGLIKDESVFNGSVLCSTTHYDYKGMILDTIYYQKCLPLHLPVKNAVTDWNQVFFRKCNTWTYLTQKTETFYDSKGNKTTSNITQYAYNENNYQPKRVTVYDEQKQNSRCTCLFYPSDKGMAGGSDYLLQKNCLSEVVRTYVYDDIFNTNKFVGGSYNNYALRNNIPVVSKCYSITPAWSTVLEMEVTKHDSYGNIREYKKKNGTPVTVIWSYNHQLPIMEIVGCTYDEACSKATGLSSLENKASVPETTMSSIHSTLMKGLPNALVTAYTYSPWQSVSQIIKPNGEKTVYSYDGYGRLSTVLDANQSTFQPIQMYNYNYKNK